MAYKTKRRRFGAVGEIFFNNTKTPSAYKGIPSSKLTAGGKAQQVNRDRPFFFIGKRAKLSFKRKIDDIIRRYF
jgi:hypothetical protein